MRSIKKNIVILGAGSSGLGTAAGLYFNDTTDNVTIIEKDNKVGGLAGSFKWKNHIIDYGPHRLSQNIPIVRTIANEIIGPFLLIKKSQHGVFINGKVYQFPIRLIDWITFKSIVFILRILLSFFYSKFTWLITRFNNDTFERVIVNRFGRFFYKTIIEPMTGKVWTDAKFIDPYFAEIRFSQIKPFQILMAYIFPKQGLNPKLFYYPSKGYQQIWDLLSQRVCNNNISLRLNTELEKIKVKDNKIVNIKIKNSNKEIKDNIKLVSTIPINQLISMLDGFSKKKLEEKISKIKFRSMILVIFEFNTNDTLPFRVMIFPEKKVIFNRLFEQNKYSEETVESGKSIVVADITVDSNDKFLKLSDAEIIKKVKNDFKRLSFLNKKVITSVKVKKIPHAYVVPDINTRKNFFEILHELKQIENLFLLGRFSVGEYDNSDFALDNGLRIGEYLCGKTSRIEYLHEMTKNQNKIIVG